MKRCIAFLCSILLMTALFASPVQAVTDTPSATQAPIDITDLSIVQLQQSVDDGLLTYETIMALFLERLEAYAQAYGCVITVNDQAMEQARACDEQYQTSGRTSLLFGLPIVVKDNIDVVGMPTTGGSELLSDSYPQENAPVVQALLDAGAIVVAKSNMDAFAMQASCSTSDYGTVKNAYDTEYTSYGSSGGSAVCLSLSLCVGALGTDTNSSLRLPAVANGVVALRPTLGLLSQEGVLPYDYERDTVGPMARSMEDLAVMYDLLTGSSCTDSLQDLDLADLTVGVIPQLSGIGEDSLYCDSQVSSYFLELLEGLEDCGAEIVYLDNIYTEEYIDIPSSTMSGWTFSAYFDTYIQGTSSSIQSFHQLASILFELEDYDNGYTVEDVENSSYLAWQTQEKATYREHLENCMDEAQVDVLLFPSMRNRVQTLEQSTELYNNTSLFASVVGFPELSIPMGMDSDGLPIGVELLARANEDSLLLQVGYALEQALGNRVERPSDSQSLYTVPDSVQELVSLYQLGIPEDTDQTLAAFSFVSQVYGEIASWFEEYPTYQGDVQLRAEELLTSYRQAWLLYHVQQENSSDPMANSSTTWHGKAAWIFLILLIVMGVIILLKRRHSSSKRNRHMTHTSL